MSRTGTPDLQPVAGPPMKALLIVATTGTMAMMAFVAVVGPIVRKLGLQESIAGIAVTCGGVLWMLLARRWGAMSDRRGRKPILLLGCLALAVANGVLAVGIDVALDLQLSALAAALLIGARAIIGAFYAAVPPTTAAVIADHTQPEQRAAYMAKLGSANAIGMVLGPALAGMLAGYRLSYALYAAAALPLIAVAVVYAVLPKEVLHAEDMNRPKGHVHLLDEHLRMAVFTGFVAMFSVSIAQVLVGFFAIDRLGLSAQDGARVAGWSLTCVGATLIIAQLCVVNLKNVSIRQWIIVGSLIAGFGFVGVGFVHSQQMLLAYYAVMAFGMGMVFPNFQAMAANAVQAHEQGAAAGTLSAAQGLGVVLGPIVGTLLYQHFNVLPYVLVGVMLWALTLLTLLRKRVVKDAI